MQPLVSIIIPNYNEERFIANTIESALNQTYSSIEILIVDDGSTDQSLEIVRKYESENDNVIVFCQENANASIARNRAIEHAKGKYYYFLDSDDIVYPNSIELMVSEMERNAADLVIGNMDEIDVDNEVINTLRFFEKNGVSNEFSDFLKVMPAPPNKLFRADIVKNQHVYFGNVNIGQDTNFFLKYLLCCRTIAYTDKILYGWRHVPTSMTHAMDFHIFDIVNSFKNTKKFYHQKGADDVYNDYIKMVEFHTYYRQMDKQRKFKTLKERLLVTDYFSFHIKQLGDLSNCRNYELYKQDVIKCNMKMKMRLAYAIQKR